MSKNIEIEAKVLIEKDGYDQLIEKFSSVNNKVYRQDNYYIDTPNFDVVENKMGLRVRRKDNGYIEMTVKDKLEEGKLEVNQELTEEQFAGFLVGKIPTGEVLHYIQKRAPIKLDELKCYAILITYRLDLHYKNSLISIDKSLYNGIIDYEVEAESTSMEQAKKELHEFLDKEKILFNENHVSKLKRVRMTLKNN